MWTVLCVFPKEHKINVLVREVPTESEAQMMMRYLQAAYRLQGRGIGAKIVVRNVYDLASIWDMWEN